MVSDLAQLREIVLLVPSSTTITRSSSLDNSATRLCLRASIRILPKIFLCFSIVSHLSINSLNHPSTVVQSIIPARKEEARQRLDRMKLREWMDKGQKRRRMKERRKEDDSMDQDEGVRSVRFQTITLPLVSQLARRVSSKFHDTSRTDPMWP